MPGPFGPALTVSSCSGGLFAVYRFELVLLRLAEPAGGGIRAEVTVGFYRSVGFANEVNEAAVVEVVVDGFMGGNGEAVVVGIFAFALQRSERFQTKPAVFAYSLFGQVILIASGSVRQ